MRWVAFLRAVNTGKRRVTNAELVQPFEALGYADVATYQAAGNVVFEVDGERHDLARAIEAAMLDAFGWEAPAFLRSIDEVVAVGAADPFSADELAASGGKVQVGFLHGPPETDVDAALGTLAPPGDRLRVIGSELFWLPVAGVGTSDLDMGAVAGVVGGLTVRTQGTVQRIAARFGDG